MIRDKKGGNFMKKYYANGFELVLDEKAFNKGEEANIHLCRNYPKKVMVAKIFKGYRRKNLPLPNEKMYQKQTTLHTESFYLPQELIHDDEGKFSGCLEDLFKNASSFTYAQCMEIKKLAFALQKIYHDVDVFTESGIRIHDMKVDHILYNKETDEVGVIDTGLFYFNEDKDLKKQNYIHMNMKLRKALLWLNKEGTETEMLSIDLPYVYDLLDTDEVSLADILLDESKKHSVLTVEELKKVYQKEKYY